VSRFDTMPSKPNLQACSKTVAPFSSVCSLIPADERTSSRAVPAHDQPIALVFDFMHPTGTGQWPVSKGRDAGGDKSVSPDEGSDHAREITACCELPQPSCCRGMSRIVISETPKTNRGLRGPDCCLKVWMSPEEKFGMFSGQVG
jgi:hypothetical protein